MDFGTFEKLVNEEARGSGRSTVAAAYLILDRSDEPLRAEAACGKGCSLCCRQIVACTTLEMDEIIQFINRMPWQKRRPLIKRLKEYAREWYRYQSKWQRQIETGARDPLDDWLGKPCPFLDKDGSCAVYPARPIDCRAKLSHKKCESMNGHDCFSTENAGYATAIICEAAKSEWGVPPLHYWLAHYILETKQLK